MNLNRDNYNNINHTDNRLPPQYPVNYQNEVNNLQTPFILNQSLPSTSVNNDNPNRPADYNNEQYILDMDSLYKSLEISNNRNQNTPIRPQVVYHNNPLGNNQHFTNDIPPNTNYQPLINEPVNIQNKPKHVKLKVDLSVRYYCKRYGLNKKKPLHFSCHKCKQKTKSVVEQK